VRLRAPTILPWSVNVTLSLVDQGDILGMVTNQETLAAIERLNDAWNTGNLDAAMDAMTDDCVFENTSPAPDGQRLEGKAAIRALWREIFATPGMRFDVEEAVVAGDRVTTRWRYRWTNDDGSEGHIRGIDLFAVRDGKVAEKLSYVKG
jgi:uncharacterized protein (TIGR02246 family)